MPEQRPMYIESIGETKSKFMGEIEEIMKKVALDAYKGETFIENYINARAWEIRGSTLLLRHHPQVFHPS